MTKCAKLGTVLGALIAGLALVDVAHATLVNVVHPGGAITATGTLADWIALGAAGFEQQDKIWTYMSSSANFPDPTTTTVMFETDVIVPGVKDIHTLTVDFNPHVSGPTSFTLSYTIAIDQTISPDFVFTTARLDSNTLSDDTLVVKTLNGGLLTLTSTNGSNTGDVPIPGDPNLLTVSEMFNVNPTGVFEGAVNGFTEQAVPEPTSVAVWGLGVGLAGAAALRRRKRRVAGGWSAENRQAILEVIQGRR